MGIFDRFKNNSNNCYLIAGLGNPGKDYENTRHNVGFKAIDALSSELGIDVNRAKFKGLFGMGRIDNKKVILLKPQTYMNLSGQSVREAAMYYDIPKENVMVIYDDFDIPLGSIRMRKSGGPGTHNGMKSVVNELGVKDFPRIRIGVGSADKNKDLTDYVVGKVPQEEQKKLNAAAEAAAKAAIDAIKIGMDNAMNKHNVTND